MSIYKYIKQILTSTKGKIDSNTVILGDFNTLIISWHRSFRQKIYKETLSLNVTLDHVNLTDTCRAFHPKAMKYTFFSNAHETFSKRDHRLDQKQVNKLKKIENISNIFSDHNNIKVEIKHKKKTAKTTNTLRLNNMLLNNQISKFKNTRRQVKMEI